MASVAAASGAGVPALAVLLISTLLGLGAGFCAGRRTRSCGGRPSQANVASHASCIGLVAVVFCLWALRNCVFSSPHFDLGALTFALAFGAAVYAVLRVSRSDDPGPARRAMQGVPLACALVALNYLIGKCGSGCRPGRSLGGQLLASAASLCLNGSLTIFGAPGRCVSRGARCSNKNRRSEAVRFAGAHLDFFASQITGALRQRWQIKLSRCLQSARAGRDLELQNTSVERGRDV
eukprot:TRINITY_DN26863_c0_g1_i2.p1 TRINITY_DN26863_c0_g1~~TRINITY_DN26863_c0_g1_i2.p1  ORF type:complete len:236 (+),score=26.95 TRINITY_DN26863_c0_g1_i2:54-761(+)